MARTSSDMPPQSTSQAVSREPWPALGIGHYRRIEDGPWGYLELREDGRFHFDDKTRPSDAEILARWAAYLVDS